MKRRYLFFDEDFFRGTLPPAFLASDSPIAIACFLLVTFLPEPLLRVPFFRSCIAFSTFLDAFLTYFAIINPPFTTTGGSSPTVREGSFCQYHLRERMDQGGLILHAESVKESSR